ncbi:MAG: FAD-dependent oxidoreductase [Deltaproteobacteria bacterium]|nr:MAG: FAD-dependent oxidoreductase [Deltaproteobacteria bacterium]
MAVEGRTHRPVVDTELCQGCGVCLRACPAECFCELRSDTDTTRGYVYTNTDLEQKEGLPPCVHACPISQEVREYVHLLEKQRVKEALLLIRRDNALPGVCGYVCHHPCEQACIRGSWDDPVAIRELKRYAVHYEMEHYNEIVDALLERKQPSRDKKVTIVGAGPAGLACAFDLVMGGYTVTVMDALAEPGGMLVAGIPAFRLPRYVIEHDISIIRSLGVEFISSVCIGREVPLSKLIQNGAHAVVLATGTWKDLTLDVPGEGARGYFQCLDFLGRVNAGKLRKLAGTVLVVGGGNAAFDAARSALRLGADQVIIAYRRSRDEMPAACEEIDAAEREGVRIRYLVAPVRIRVERGKVTGVNLIRMRLGDADETGRMKPLPIEESEFIEKADIVIPALGQRPDLSFLELKDKFESTTLSCDPSGRVSGYDNLFAAGDAVTGPSTVVEAMGSGKAVARRVMDYLEMI